MKRFWLCLPVCLLGMALSVYLLLATASAERPAAHEEQVVDHSVQSEDALPDQDPLVFLEQCVARYDREVQGYHCLMKKQERINGVLHDPEEIEVAFREKPFSVYMRWLKGAVKADRALYVERENNGKLLAHPAAHNMLGGAAKLFGIKVVPRDVDGADAHQSGRYLLNEFGIKKGTERTLTAWKAARAAGTLHVAYLGVFEVPELGNNHLCYKLQRTSTEQEDNGITEVTIYIDKDSWLQVGSVLKGVQGTKRDQLIGQYFFCKLQLNPVFKKDQFKPVAVSW